MTEPGCQCGNYSPVNLFSSRLRNWFRKLPEVGKSSHPVSPAVSPGLCAGLELDAARVQAGVPVDNDVGTGNLVTGQRQPWW